MDKHYAKQIIEFAKENKETLTIRKEIIIDEYIYCDPLGMSQEDPTIVVTPVESRTFTGGAGIVAGHVASLGALSHYISVTGDDETANKTENSLASTASLVSHVGDS